MVRVKQATFRGKRWKVTWRRIKEDYFALCDDPKAPEKEISIDPAKNGDGIRMLETLVHEALHACFWDLEEEAIGGSAADIARFLYSIGWRLKNDAQVD